MVYLRNRTLSKEASTIPFAALTGRDPDLSNLRVVGCPPTLTLTPLNALSFFPRLGKTIVVGYAFDSPAWHAYNPSTNKVIRSRSVIFNKAWTLSPSSSGEPSSSPPLISGEHSYPLTHVSEFDDQSF